MKSILKIKYILAILLGVFAVANAQDKATLDLLVKKGIISADEAAQTAKEAAATVLPKDKKVKSLKITGRVQTQFEYTDATGAQERNDFYIRRAYLGAAADFGNGYSGKVVINVADGCDIDTALVSKTVDLGVLNGKIDAGYKKVNFGYEENTSSSKLFALERSFATRYWAESGSGTKIGFGSHHTGLYFNGKVNEVKGLSYGLAITNSYNKNPASDKTVDGDMSYWANVKYKTSFDKVDLEAGLNFGYAAGELSSEASNTYGINPYVAVGYAGFRAWAELLVSGVEDSSGQTNTPLGVNVAAEYRFDTDGFGQIAPIVRYSYLDTDGRGMTTSDFKNVNSNGVSYNACQGIYVGINWYILGDTVKFQTGYEWAQLNGAYDGSSIADVNTVRAQLQVLF